MLLSLFKFLIMVKNPSFLFSKMIYLTIYYEAKQEGFSIEQGKKA